MWREGNLPRERTSPGQPAPAGLGGPSTPHRSPQAALTPPSLCPQHRQLLKDSFMVELVEGARKLRHVFLFTDLLLCTKLKKQSGG